jgi:PadR family transcriptional regulator, regulatory protein PadR
MPGGYGPQHGGMRGRGRGRRIINYLQPCLLLMLCRENAHGYNLAAGLEEFGFVPDQYDSSLIYRALREMEDEKLVLSQWDEDSLGPKRRVYNITPLGRQYLDEWMQDLERLQVEINTLMREYNILINKKGE